MYIGTLLFTWFKGEIVGTDEFGNRYYRSRGKRLHGRERRWVMYRGRAEASTVPAEWNAWLHHTVDEPLTDTAAQAKGWQKGHQPNLSGSDDAYRPKGHEYQGGDRAHATGDYEAWNPDS